MLLGLLLQVWSQPISVQCFNVYSIKTKSMFPLQALLYGFKGLIKQEQRDLTAVPREPLQVYSFSARGSHGEQLQLQREAIKRVVPLLSMTIDLCFSISPNFKNLQNWNEKPNLCSNESPRQPAKLSRTVKNPHELVRGVYKLSF